MKGNFIYFHPAKIYFGDKAQENPASALNGYGKRVLFVYGGGFTPFNRSDVIEQLEAGL